MNRCFVFIAPGLVASVLVSTAHAQLLPLPVPPLPPPSFDIVPDSGHSASSAPIYAPSTGSRGLDAALRESSPTSMEALRRSRFHESWYGWQTLTADAASVGILLLGAAVVTTRPPSFEAAPAPRPVAFMAVSWGVYATGPAIVHFVHGDIWQAFVSVGLRILMPLAGYAIGAIVGGALEPRGDPASAGTFGGLVGSAAATVSDAGALSWHRWYAADVAGQASLLLRARAAF